MVGTTEWELKGKEPYTSWPANARFLVQEPWDNDDKNIWDPAGRGIPKKHTLKSENKGENHPDHFGGLDSNPRESYDP